MDNSVDKDTPLVQQPLTDQSSSNSDDEEVITQLTLAGLKVLMVRKRDQIIYKLPDNMQVSSIKEEQRQQLMKEIQALHQATMAAAASAQQKQQLQQGAADIKPIAPKNEPPSLDTPPQPTAAEADAIKETARKLREELEQQQSQFKQQQQMYPYDSNPSSPHDSSKTTRRYNKTGKYSKKKLQQHLHQQFSQQLQQLPFQQQQQFTQQQLLALQQSLQGNAVSSINTMMLNNSTPNVPLTASTSSTPQTPISLYPQQQQFDSLKSSPAPTPPPITPTSQKMQSSVQPQPDTILAKRLPDEELQHREVKKRCIESLLSDQKAVTTPDYQTPFTSMKDAIDRLLPYHIYRYPKKDLDANKIPLERQDHTMIEIFKCQVDLFDKYSAIVKKIGTNGGRKSLEILVQRQVLAEQRQKLTEEQARVASEQAAQQQEQLRVQAEKARLASMAEQEARQQHQLQHQHQIQQQLQQQQQIQPQQIQPQQLQPQQQLQQQMQQLQPEQLQQLMQQMSTQQAMSQLEQFQMQQQLQHNPATAANYANGLAQASALLSNPQFQSQYSQLPVELQERLNRNREHLVALIEKQQNSTNNSQQ